MTTAKAYGGKKTQSDYDADAWSTPQWLFDELDKEFNFTLDPCADDDNHKCLIYYTAKVDGLTKSWAGHVVFMNPPYSQVDKWLEKAWKESDDCTVVALVKADTSTDWWHKHWKRASEVRFLKRIQFQPPPGYTGRLSSPNMGSALLIYGWWL